MNALLSKVRKVRKVRKVTEERLVRLDLEDNRVRHLLSLALLVRKVNGENSLLYRDLKELLENLSKESKVILDRPARLVFEDPEDLEDWTVRAALIQLCPDQSVYEVCPECLALLPSNFKTSSAG